MNDQERIARLEEWKDMYSVASEKLNDRNDKDHKLILDRLDDLEISLIVYRRVVYFVGATLGMVAGTIIHYWDFVINKMGH